MRRHSVRVFVAILTFTFGISIFWVTGLIPRVETALVDGFFNSSDVGPVSLAGLNSDEEANEIYRLLVHRKFIFDDETKLIVLKAETTGCPMYEDEYIKEKFGVTEPFHQMVSEWMPEAEAQTLNNYLLSNETGQDLKVRDLGINYVLVRNDDLPDGRFDDFWGRFSKKYPNSPGIVFFSEVGFNDRFDQAFVYVGRSCGGLCGAGEYVLLSKVKGRWVVTDEQDLWVS